MPSCSEVRIYAAKVHQHKAHTIETVRLTQVLSSTQGTCESKGWQQWHSGATSRAARFSASQLRSRQLGLGFVFSLWSSHLRCTLLTNCFHASLNTVCIFSQDAVANQTFQHSATYWYSKLWLEPPTPRARLQAIESMNNQKTQHNGMVIEEV